MEKKVKTIGILSDTHDLLRPEVLKALEGTDMILHGGDISSPEILGQLETIAAVKAVRGNNDKDWANAIPAILEETICGLHVLMTHKKKDLPEDLSAYDLVVYGHSHKYEMQQKKGTVILNPGSCGPRRFNQEITMARLYVSDEGGIDHVERIDIPHEGPLLHTADLKKKDIEKIGKMQQKGKTYRQIAEKLHLEEAVAEQVCRLYSTHPGVDAEGVMKKMGL